MSKSKKKWIVITVIIVILIIALMIIRMYTNNYYHPSISMVETISNNPDQLTISWYDEEPNQVYRIYWSNKSGINPYQPTTYLGVRSSTSIFNKSSYHHTTLHAPYEWVYFIIVKSHRKTREYEAPVMRDTTFTCNNLDVKLLKRGDDKIPITLGVDVLNNAETYRIYHILSDGNSLYQDYDVTGHRRTNLRIPVIPDAMVYITFLKNGIESDAEFLLHNEKISLDDVKWQTTTQLC